MNKKLENYQNELSKFQNEIMENIITEAKEKNNEFVIKALKFEVENEGQKETNKLRLNLKEPLRNNRFIVSFPQELGIESWWIKSISSPRIENKKWDDMSIEFINFINPSTNKILYDKLLKKKNFDIQIKFLDAAGNSVQEFTVKIKSVISIDFGGYISYSDDSILKTVVDLKVKKCELKF